MNVFKVYILRGCHYEASGLPGAMAALLHFAQYRLVVRPYGARATPESARSCDSDLEGMNGKKVSCSKIHVQWNDEADETVFS